MTLKEKIEEWKETLSVKWFMLDAQQKQAAIMMGLYVWIALLGIAQKLAERKLGLKGVENE